MADRRPFAVSPTLTAIAIAFRNPAYSLIADIVMPRSQVGSERFKWTYYDIAQGFTVPDTRVGRKGRVNQVEFMGEERDGSTEDHALDAPIPNSDIDEARKLREQGLSAYDPEKVATQYLTDLTILDREIRVADTVQDPNNYAAGNQYDITVATDRFDDPDSNPFDVLDTALSAVLGMRPNLLCMGQPVWTKLKKHPRLIKAVKGGLTDEGAITRQQLAELIEVPQILVGEGRVNIARPGQPMNLTYCWGKSIQGLFINPVATTQMGMTWGLTAENGSRVAGTIEDKDIGMRGGLRVRVGEAVRELVVAQECGFIIENAVT